MAMLLLAEHCTVTIAHSRTRDLPEVALADIALSGRPARHDPGRAGLKPGAIRIDVGINRVAGEGKSTATSPGTSIPARPLRPPLPSRPYRAGLGR